MQPLRKLGPGKSQRRCGGCVQGSARQSWRPQVTFALLLLQHFQIVFDVGCLVRWHAESFGFQLRHALLQRERRVNDSRAVILPCFCIFDSCFLSSVLSVSIMAMQTLSSCTFVFRLASSALSLVTSMALALDALIMCMHLLLQAGLIMHDVLQVCVQALVVVYDRFLTLLHLRHLGLHAVQHLLKVLKGSSTGCDSVLAPSIFSASLCFCALVTRSRLSGVPLRGREPGVGASEVSVTRRGERGLNDEEESGN